VKKIVYFNHTSGIDGAGFSLYRLILALPKGINPIVVLLAEGELSKALRSAGVDVIVEPNICPLMGNTHSAGLWKWWNWRYLAVWYRGMCACQRICEEEAPDIVHLNSSVLLHLAEGAKKAGVEKVVLHVREHWGLKKWEPREWLKRRKVSRFVDEIVAISQTSAELFGYNERTTVVYNWPGFEGRDAPIEIGPEYGISPNKKVVLLLGGRSRIKGTIVALRAMELVHDKDATVLLLCGADSQKGRIGLALRRMGGALKIKTSDDRLNEAIKNLKDRVCVVPAIKNIKSLIEQSCVVVSPFTTPHFSMPSLEAGLLRKPVVISDNGHARETVLDGMSGLVVPAGDVRALAEALNRLLSNPVLREKMGEAGHDYVERHFNQRIGMKKLMGVYGVNYEI